VPPLSCLLQHWELFSARDSYSVSGGVGLKMTFTTLLTSYQPLVSSGPTVRLAQFPCLT
jgi:hypothetical protein